MFRVWAAIVIAPLCLAGTNAATAKDAPIEAPALDIRPVEQSSTDVFDVLSQLIQAQTAYAKADYATAFEAYRYVYLHDPSQAAAKLGYADSALAIGDIRLAQALYKNMDGDAAHAGQVLCAVILGETEFPEAALRARLTASPKDTRLWNALGRVLDGQAQGNEAREAYVMAGLAGQRAGLTENNLGQSFLTEGDWDAALAHFSRAARQAPEDRKFDNNRRLVLLLQGKYGPGLTGLDGQQASALLADAGLIAARKEDLTLARFLLTKAQTLSPVYNARLADYISKLG